MAISTGLSLRRGDRACPSQTWIGGAGRVWLAGGIAYSMVIVLIWTAGRNEDGELAAFSCRMSLS